MLYLSIYLAHLQVNRSTPIRLRNTITTTVTVNSRQDATKTIDTNYGDRLGVRRRYEYIGHRLAGCYYGLAKRNYGKYNP